MKKFINYYFDSFRGLPRDVWLLSAVLFVNRSGSMVLTFLTLYLTQELGFGLTAAGQVMSAYGVGHLLGAWVGGWLCDRVGALRIQFLSLMLSGAGYFVLEQVRTLPSILLLTVGIATAAEAFRPANGAALAAFSPVALRTRAFAFNRMALNLGFSVGPAVGGWLALRDYSLLFWVDGLTCILAGICIHFFFRGRSAAAELEAEAPGEERTLHPFKDGPFWVYLLLVALIAVCFFQCWSTLPIYFNEAYGLDESQFGLLMALNAILILLFEMVLTHRVSVFRPLTVIGFGGFLTGLGLVMLPFGRTWLMATGAMAVLTFGEMLFSPTTAAWVANRSGALHRGKFMGLYTMAWGVAFIAAPSGGAWVYQHWGADQLWFLMGLVGMGSWLGCEALHWHIERTERAAT